MKFWEILKRIIGKISSIIGAGLLFAVTAYVLRYVHNLRKAQPRTSGPLSSVELTNAQLYLIRGIQRSTYREEFAYLLKKQPKCPPLVRQLRLYLDDNQLIRSGRRIHNAPTTELAKFPFLLPSNSLFTNMIVMATHRWLHHGGVSITITALRQVYWIPSARQYIRKLL